MRLSVIVPAYNEAESVADVVARVPSTLPSVTGIRVFVVDDGSTDATAERARTAGANVVSHPVRRGLAEAFRTGVHASLRDGADLLATLDADGQYRPEDLAVLLRTMRETDADIVVGDRQVELRAHMPAGNRVGNRIGSWMLRRLAGIPVTDASSGLRMFTAGSARRMRIVSEHTYTHEMLIQASAAGMRIAEAKIDFLPRPHGRSKLVRTLHRHILRSCGTILRALFVFRPLRNFLILAGLTACVMVVAGLSMVIGGRYAPENAVLVVVLGAVAFQFVLIGLVAEFLASQRRIDSAAA